MSIPLPATVQLTRDRIEAAYQKALAALLELRDPEGYWEGELSTSALSTATAVMALALVQQKALRSKAYQVLIANGIRWLAENQNPDGGWGDTIKSISNISTTMLCRSAFTISGFRDCNPKTMQKMENWLHKNFGRTSEELAEAVRSRYGKDRTFAVPILTTCAIAGLMDWKEVEPLPFELACFPQSLFRLLRLHVVSYALPALIGIGQCVHQHRSSWNPFLRLIRWLARKPSLRVLEKIQPENGGFLEATPLTSFVTLALAQIGLGNHPVAKKGTKFIVQSVRPDGSWPIDTNLSTWVTTLSINALATAGELGNLEKKNTVLVWLENQQYQEIHPYTGAKPGAWAWTPLPGGVPDADDTPGALLALRNLLSCRSGHPARSNGSEREPPQNRTGRETRPTNQETNGIQWLLDLQNADGGWPTFCRGWGYLPFDRSSPDLTAHALRALNSQHYPKEDPCYQRIAGRVNHAITTGFIYLAKCQREDGSWLPLWFGNQYAEDDINPTYGTSRVLAAYRDCGRMEEEPARRGIAWILANQNEDGGWGGCLATPTSIEETALPVEILMDFSRLPFYAPLVETAVNKGLSRLVDHVEKDELNHPTPIGFYFAKLWYYEKLYPVIFAVAALGKARQLPKPEQNFGAKDLF